MTERPLSQVLLHLDPNPANSRIEVDGEPVEGVYGISLSASIDETPSLTIEYGCAGVVVDVSGEFITHHLCPVGGKQ